MKRFWIGIKGKVVNKIYIDDITEFCNLALEQNSTEDVIMNHIASKHKGFMHFFIEAKNQQEAMDVFMKNYTKNSHLDVVK